MATEDNIEINGHPHTSGMNCPIYDKKRSERWEN